MIVRTISDLHISTNGYNDFYPLPDGIDSIKEILSRNGIDRNYFERPKHNTSLELFRLRQPGVIRALSKCDLVIVNGDTFDINPEGSNYFSKRDMNFNDDIMHVLFEILDKLDAPVLFLQGNTDLNNYGNRAESNYKLTELNQRGKSKIAEASGKSFQYDSMNGNFSIQTKDLLVLGINSTSVSYSHPESENINRSFIIDKLESNKLPVLICTHHPAFAVLPEEVTNRMGIRYLKKQEWLDQYLENYSRERSIQVTMITGHVHTKFEKADYQYQRFCLRPAFQENSGSRSFGIEVESRRSERNHRYIEL